MIDKDQDNGMQRRDFLKWGGAGLLSFPLLTKAKLAFGTSVNGWSQNYWQGPEGSEYCVQKTVYDGQVDEGYIWARVDGWWKKFTIRDLEETFWDWNMGERNESFEEQLSGEPYEFRSGGPHSPSVATYGNKRGRGDSDFHLNNKIIGINCAPDKDHAKEINDTMLQMIEDKADQKTKVAYLLDIHQQDIWRKDIQLGTELFSDPTWHTHTFYNLMENPVATICFVGRYDIFNSFEIRCIAQIIHPLDPNLSDDLYQLAIFPSVLHGFYHGFYPDDINEPAVLYYSVEEFHNSVGERGTRLVHIMKEKLKRFFA